MSHGSEEVLAPLDQQSCPRLLPCHLMLRMESCQENFLEEATPSKLCNSYLFHAGVRGVDGDGDIMNCDNMMEFQKFVLDNTDGQGVHFFMADGVSGNNFTSIQDESRVSPVFFRDFLWKVKKIFKKF